MSEQEMVGASKALNKTITEILEHLGEDGADRPGPFEDKRKYLYDKLNVLMIKRYKQGFKRGHKEAFRMYEDTKTFPHTLSYRTAKAVIGGAKRPFICSSKLSIG